MKLYSKLVAHSQSTAGRASDSEPKGHRFKSLLEQPWEVFHLYKDSLQTSPNSGTALSDVSFTNVKVIH